MRALLAIALLLFLPLVFVTDSSPGELVPVMDYVMAETSTNELIGITEDGSATPAGSESHLNSVRSTARESASQHVRDNTLSRTSNGRRPRDGL